MISPWPWALRNGQEAIYAASQEAAKTLLNQAILDKEKYMIDIGLMQINLHWHGHRVNSPAELLDPTTNLNVGAQILSEAIKSSPSDLEIGIGRYHSWNKERARWYGRRVLSIYQNILHELEVHQ